MKKWMQALPLAGIGLVGADALAEDRVTEQREELEAIFARQRSDYKPTAAQKFQPEAEGLRGGKLLGVPLSPIDPGIAEHEVGNPTLIEPAIPIE
ncbi:MAG: hypothetical protein AAGD47_14665 [Pseudomonadota bacterium]